MAGAHETWREKARLYCGHGSEEGVMTDEKLTAEEIRFLTEIAEQEWEYDWDLNIGPTGERLRPAVGESALWLWIRRLLRERREIRAAAEARDREWRLALHNLLPDRVVPVDPISVGDWKIDSAIRADERERCAAQLDDFEKALLAEGDTRYAFLLEQAAAKLRGE